MYNLNYNVTNCRLNKPVGRPFVPFGRPDPYSASLVLAIPGNIFRQGYVSVFNQLNVFDDISGYLKGDAIFDETIGEYIPAYASHTITPTGDNGFVGPNSLNNFSANGYETSLIVSGNMALISNKLTSSVLGKDFALSKDTPWTVEGWFAYDVTASLIGSGGLSSPSQSVWYGAPNKQLISQWYTPNPTGSSYIVYSGFSARTEDASIVPPPLTLISGSTAFYYDSNLHAGNPDYRINSYSSSLITPYVWQHTAITCYPSASVGVVNMYINGELVGSGSITNEIGITPNTIVTLLGNPNPYTGSVVNAINNTNYATGSGIFVQDFRFYNGAAKYTGSSFTPPASMIVGLQEPYPQYNP